MSAALRVVVVGARGRLGSFACDMLRGAPDFELVAHWDSRDDWRSLAPRCGAQVALEATRAGLGFEHARALLDSGLCVVVATSGVTAEENADLDRQAQALGLGGIVVPNFSVGSWLLQRFAAEAARWFEGAEVVESHHVRKHDAPSGTALETARRMNLERERAGLAPFQPKKPEQEARGKWVGSVPIHSLRLPGFYAHQEVVLGSAGELLRLSHDMHGPEAFGPGLRAALRYAAGARGVARGVEVALDHASRG